MMITRAILSLITLACTFSSSLARSDGAPEEACSTLTPSHGDSKPQQTAPPYYVTTKYLHDNTVEVMIYSSAGKMFKGFILQARSASDKNKTVAGEFKTDGISKVLKCDGLEKGTLTHVSSEPKVDVTTEWTGNADDLIFRATVVQDWATFWTNIDSDPVDVGGKSNPASNLYDCGNSGCIGMPEECVENDNCTVLLKFNVNPDGGITFTLTGELEKNHYMAMGISKDAKMGDDFVTECLIVSSGDVKLRKSWNEGMVNMHTADMSHGSVSFKDGKATCIWNYPKVLTFNDKKYDLTNKPYILLAYGPLKEGSEKLNYHSKRMPTSEPVDLFSSKSINPDDYSKSLKQITVQKPDEMPTTELTTKSHVTDSCSRLSFGLFWLALFGVFYASGINVLNDI